MDHQKKIFITPILTVDSVAASLTYYQDKLGFTVGFRWSDALNRMLRKDEPMAPTFASIYLEDIEIFLSEKSLGNPGSWVHLTYPKAAWISFIKMPGSTEPLSKARWKRSRGVCAKP